MKQLLIICCLVASCGGCCEEFPIPILCPPTPTPPIPQETESRKVAVLISTDFAEVPDSKGAGFWYDTVLTYCMLRHNGFKDEDIWVMYGTGLDGFYSLQGSNVAGFQPVSATFYGPLASGPAHYYVEPSYCDGLEVTGSVGALTVTENITDLPITFPGGYLKTTVDGQEVYRPQQLFSCLAHGCDPKVDFNVDLPVVPKLSSDDDNSFLFVWWRGHGAPVTKEDALGNLVQSVSFTLPGSTPVSATDIVSWISEIDAGHRFLVFETCHSGCLDSELGNLADTTVLFSSAGCSELANNEFQPDVHHAVWTFWLAGALQGVLPNEIPSQIPAIGTPSTAINLQFGGPLNEIFEESSKATTLLFESQQPESCSPDNLDQRTKINRSAPVLPAIGEPEID